MMPLVSRVSRHIEGVRWAQLDPAVRARVPVAILDLLGCAVAGYRLGVHQAWVKAMVTSAGPPESTLWGHNIQLPAAHAALVNGAIAHHVEMDDGNPRASVHGGVTVVPVALAVGEVVRASGEEVLTAVVAGYDAAVACGRALVRGMTAHRLHEPSMVGCFGATATAARLLGLPADRIAAALSLAGTLMPFGPFEAFTKGAPVKDLYGGWPAFIGVMAAQLTKAGLSGPTDLFEAAADGVGSALLHAPVTDSADADPRELLHVQFKPYATCRSVQPTLTAVEQLLPVDPYDVDTILVETYPFAVELSRDSDPETSVGAKTSIPYAVASLILDGQVGPEAFTVTQVGNRIRQALAARVKVRSAGDMEMPVVRGARVTIVFKSGIERHAEVRATRWTDVNPATEEELRTKFRRLAGEVADPIECAVDHLVNASDLDELMMALKVKMSARTI
jgi:2-methylcitrate dehydratase PrpD